MITSIPRASAVVANSAARCGVRCADMTCDSCGTPKSFSVSDAERITSQSDLLPTRTATREDAETRRRGDAGTSLFDFVVDFELAIVLRVSPSPCPRVPFLLFALIQ